MYWLFNVGKNKSYGGAIYSCEKRQEDIIILIIKELQGTFKWDRKVQDWGQKAYHNISNQ